VITPDDRTVTGPFLFARQDPVITDPNEKMQSKNVDHLPPLLRSQALHTRLPRDRKLPYVGIAVTVLLHVAILAFLYVNRGKMPENVFFPKLFPLDEKAMQQHKGEEAAAPSTGPAAR
jgi:hypothetical protein